MRRTENRGSNYHSRSKKKKKQSLTESSSNYADILIDLYANDSSGCSGCVSSRASMVVMEEGGFSCAGAILKSIQRAYLLWLSDPRQEQRQLEAIAERYILYLALSRTIRLSLDLVHQLIPNNKFWSTIQRKANPCETVPL